MRRTWRCSGHIVRAAVLLVIAIEWLDGEDAFGRHDNSRDAAPPPPAAAAASVSDSDDELTSYPHASAVDAGNSLSPTFASVSEIASNSVISAPSYSKVKVHRCN